MECPLAMFGFALVSPTWSSTQEVHSTDLRKLRKWRSIQTSKCLESITRSKKVITDSCIFFTKLRSCLQISSEINKKLHSCSSNTFVKSNIYHGNNWFSLQYYDSPQDDLVKENFMFTDKWMDMKSSQLHYMSAICLLTARNWADAMGKNKVKNKPKLNKFMNSFFTFFRRLLV